MRPPQDYFVEFHDEDTYEEAEALWSRALDICVKAHGPSHEDTKNVATGLFNLLGETDRDAEAEALHEKFGLESDSEDDSDG